MDKFNLASSVPPESEYGFRWAEKRVARSREHIKMHWGDPLKQSWDEFEVIGLMGPPVRNIFPIQILVGSTTPDDIEKVKEIRRKLDFYLIELRKAHPWEYAIYHCSTCANIYDPVHWAYFPQGDRGSSKHSDVVHRDGKPWILKNS